MSSDMETSEAVMSSGVRPKPGAILRKASMLRSTDCLAVAPFAFRYCALTVMRARSGFAVTLPSPLVTMWGASGKAVPAQHGTVNSRPISSIARIGKLHNEEDRGHCAEAAGITA